MRVCKGMYRAGACVCACGSMQQVGTCVLTCARARTVRGHACECVDMENGVEEAG